MFGEIGNTFYRSEGCTEKDSATRLFLKAEGKDIRPLRSVWERPRADGVFIERGNNEQER